MEISTYQHLNPVWRNRADFIISIVVPPIPPLPDGIYWEQLWARQIEDRKFEICCIPSFAFDLALGDIVETDKEYMVSRVVERSGYFTIRIWFYEHAADKRQFIEKTIQAFGCLIEVYSENLSGVSSNSEKIKVKLMNKLRKFRKNGWIEIETGFV